METQAAVMLGRPLGVPYQEVDAEVGSLKAFDITRNLIHVPYSTRLTLMIHASQTLRLLVHRELHQVTHQTT